MKSTHTKLNVHGQRKTFAFGTQRNHISLTRVGEKFASPNARDTNMLVFFALANAKVLSLALGDAKVPNANGFASQWNIGFSLGKIPY